MARSPLTLAASVTSALPNVGVVSVATLTEGGAGRFDSAVATLDDGRRVVVRIPVDAAADADLAAEVKALRALTAGVRAVLPYGAPDVLGEARVDDRGAVVQTLLPGYRVDAAHVPSGPGVATALGRAVADIHDLPPTVVRDAGLPLHTPGQVRDGVERLLDRAEATGRLPFGLLRRWSSAIGLHELWRFESTVCLGGVEPAAFVLGDGDAGPRVTGLLTWGGLSVGDPAVDLRWTASAPDARDDVLTAYTRASHRAPDAMLRERSRLYAELEFAKWLVHGHTSGSESVVEDAVALLEALAENVRDEPLVELFHVSADDAIAASSRVPESPADAIDTSMHTDSYGAEEIAAFTAEDRPQIDLETVPVELTDWTRPAPAASDADADGEPGDDTDTDRAARNALRRWTETA